MHTGAMFGMVVLTIFILGTFTIAFMLFPNFLRYMKMRSLWPIIPTLPAENGVTPLLHVPGRRCDD